MIYGCITIVNDDKLCVPYIVSNRGPTILKMLTQYMRHSVRFITVWAGCLEVLVGPRNWWCHNESNAQPIENCPVIKWSYFGKAKSGHHINIRISTFL